MGNAVSAVGSFVSGIGEGVGNAFGFGAPKKMGSGGSFSMTKEGMEGEKETIQRLRERASGTAPSISELQYKQALDETRKAQQSAVASARGASNPMLLQRQALQMGQQAGLDVARESAAAKLAEQRAAEQSILQQAAAQRRVASQAAQANLLAEQQRFGSQMGFLGSLGTAGALLYAGSDENMKKDIKKSEKSGNELVEDFLNALKSYTYEYKDKEVNGKKNPDGEVTSVMAQDLEKSELGKKMVKDTPEGKMVDYAQGMAPLFAAIAELNERTKKLEKKG